MSRIKGSVKTGGKVKGSVHKPRRELYDEMRKKYPNYNPVIAMATIANDKYAEEALRFQAHKEVAKYLYPQLAATQVNLNTDDKKFIFTFVDADRNRIKKPT